MVIVDAVDYQHHQLENKYEGLQVISSLSHLRVESRRHVTNVTGLDLR